MDANEDLIRRLFDATNRKDLDAVAALYAHEFELNGTKTALSDYTASMPAFFDAFPDADGTIEALVTDRDTVVARWRTAARHLGDFAGVPPTGRRVEWSGINWYRIEDGRIVAMWQAADTLGLLQQIGAVTMAPAPKRRAEHPPAIRFDVKLPPRKDGNGSNGAGG